ncbi:MAG: tetratricopeptide repeat protein [Bacteroidales bacterium]
MFKNIALTVTFTGALLGSILAQKPELLVEKADKRYTEGKYQDAIDNYEAVVGQGLQNAELYYNLGNAYFKIKNIPAAILNYERAYRLNPNSEDIRFNLDLAKTYTVDKIEALPEFFFVSFVKRVKFEYSSNSWAYIAAISFAVTLALTLFFWFSSSFSVRRLAFSLGILLVLIFVVSLMFSVSLKNRAINQNEAIVFAPVVSVKSSPDNSGKDLFILHAGTKVELVRPLGDWYEVKIADGNKGWLLKSDFQRI